MKKVKYLLLILCFCLIFSGCSKKKELEKQGTTPLLIEVTKDGYNSKLYLFGSIHAADDTMYPLSDKIINAYQGSDYVAAEFDLIEYMNDMSSQISGILPFMYSNNKSIKDDISDDLYKKVQVILEDADLYSSLYDRYKPIIWMGLVENAVINNSALDEQKGIDMYFLNKAKEDKKEIIELESANYQYGILSSFDIPMQVYLLEEIVNNYDASLNQMKDLYELYKKGNKEDLENLLFSDEEMNEYDKIYNNALITVRNEKMTKLLEEYFAQDKNFFCTVGLAHIIGDNGIANLLKQDGYKVEVK